MSISVSLKDRDVHPLGVSGPSLTVNPDCDMREEENQNGSATLKGSRFVMQELIVISSYFILTEIIK